MKRARLAELEAAPAVREALAMFLAKLSSETRSHIVDVILFGSTARGDATGKSDVDLLVVWEGGLVQAFHDLIEASTAVLLETGALLSVHPVAKEQFARISKAKTAFYENVEREGVVVEG